MRRRTWLTILVLLAAGMLLLVNLGYGLLPAIKLALGDAGDFFENDNCIIAIRLENQGSAAAPGVMLTRITLESQMLVKPAMLPMTVGDIPAGEDAVLQLAFSKMGLNPGGRARLTIHGTYQARTTEPTDFEVMRTIVLPPPDEGSRTSRAGMVEPQVTAGPYPASQGMNPKEANDDDGPPLPEGKTIGRFQPNGIPTDQRPQGMVLRGAAVEPHAVRPAAVALSANDPVTLVRSGTQTVSGNLNFFPWDPSGASVDVPNGTQLPQRLVFLSGNTYALMSTNGGSSFTRLDPTTIFPQKTPLLTLLDGGLCCDQVIQYIPGIDRIVWLMQFSGVTVDFSNGKPVAGRNRIRIAAASPAQVIASNGTQWTYWDITSYGDPYDLNNGLLDYPDMSFTNNFLHISIDAAGEAPSNGMFVTRIPLLEIQGGLAIHFRFTEPSDGSSAYTAHMTQDSPDGAYWFGQNSTSNIRIFDWQDNSDDYFWRSLDVDSWQNSDYKTPTPSGADWLGAVTFAQGAVRGATMYKNVKLGPSTAKVIKVAWGAARGGGFPQPYVRLVDVTRIDSGVGVIQWSVGNEAQIWSPSFAFSYPYLTTNANGEVGISLAAGGGGSEATPMVGFVGDSAMYYLNQSTTSIARWGDYSAIRKHPQNPKLFSVSDYFLNGSGTAFPANSAIHQYRMFGRTADVGGTT